MYIDAGMGSSDEAVLVASLTGTSTSRTWKIRVNFTFSFSSFYANYSQVTQVLCSDIKKPPQGCLQYHTGVTGRVKKRKTDDDNTNELKSFVGAFF